jgi:hypothetical protein
VRYAFEPADDPPNFFDWRDRLFYFFRQNARAADELVPPFGFRWNDSMARVEAVLHGAKAKLVSREKKENREVWTVEGLIHPGLKRTVFTFKERALVAVELQYEYPDWSSNVTTSGWEKFEILRRKIRHRKTGVTFSRPRHRRDSNTGRISMDGRYNDARAVLFLSATR